MSDLINFKKINTEVSDEEIVDQVVDALKEEGYNVVSDFEKFGDDSEICEILEYKGEVINQRQVDFYRFDYDLNRQVTIYENYYDDNDSEVVLSVNIL